MRNQRIAQLAVGVGALLVTSIAEAAAIRDLGNVTAKAAMLIDNQTDEVLFARNPDLQLPPASTTKVLTALVVHRSGKLSRDLRVSLGASKMQPSKIGLKPGWTMNTRDLLYATLLESANDASVVLAEGVAGSVPSFAALMNTTARSLGATRSNFVNPNGLPAKAHYSTVRDLTTIMRHVLDVPDLREILATRSMVIRPRSGSKRRITLRSKNRLLARQHMQVIGKTGYTRRAKRCFVGAASLADREIIVAMLGSENLWGDLDLLINYGLNPPGPQPAWSNKVGWQQAFAPPTEAPPEGDAGEVDTQAFRYHVQLASFRSRTRAHRLSKEVEACGYKVTVEPTRGAKYTMYSVTVRDFDTRASARRAARILGKRFRVDPLIVAVRT